MQTKNMINKQQASPTDLWAMPVDVFYTDGFQVAPGMRDGESVEVYFSELKRQFRIT